MAKNRKERQRQKRKQKQRSLQRARSVSLYRQIGTRGEVVACYVTDDWLERGLASIFCLCRVPGGGHAMASFLVDLWCIGLKDAWGRLDMTGPDFQEMIRRHSGTGADLVRVDLDLVRRLVAGGIRFGRQNGMGPPHRYERWTAMLGDLGDIDTAELSDFGVDGGLRFVGEIDDLRRRLVNTTVDEFFGRDGIDYVAGIGGSTAVERADPAGDDLLDEMCEKAVHDVHEWCAANGISPSPHLGAAWTMILATSVVAEIRERADESARDRGSSLEECEKDIEPLMRLFASAPSDIQDELAEAMRQIMDYGKDRGFDEVLLNAPEEDRGLIGRVATFQPKLLTSSEESRGPR